MTLLSVCKDVSDEIGYPRPSSLVASTGNSERRMLAHAKSIGKEISKLSWAALIKEHSFSTVASTGNYALPSDYRFMVSDTVWNRTEADRVFGPLSSETWQEYKSGILTSIRDSYRIKSTLGIKQFYIDPVPTSIETFVFEYVSTEWVENSGTLKSDFTLDSDTTLFDEDLLALGLKWRLLRSIGKPYEEEKNEYEDAVNNSRERDLTSSTISMVPVSNRFLAVTPESGFG